MPTGLQDLRCDIVRRPTDSFSFFGMIIDSGSKSKISHLHLHIRIQKQVTKLKIAMDDLPLMQILQRLQNLHHIIFDLALSKFFLALQKII